jgi:choline dehydrogenase-like flavoprotein
MTTSAGIWDYMVIGAGHNGLTAATTLAHQGQSVLVVERLPNIGGLTTSLPRVPAAPRHLLHVGAMDDMFMAGTSLACDLRLADHGYRPIELERPYGWMAEEGDTLVLANTSGSVVIVVRRRSASTRVNRSAGQRSRTVAACLIVSACAPSSHQFTAFQSASTYQTVQSRCSADQSAVTCSLICTSSSCSPTQLSSARILSPKSI